MTHGFDGVRQFKQVGRVLLDRLLVGRLQAGPVDHHQIGVGDRPDVIDGYLKGVRVGAGGYERSDFDEITADLTGPIGDHLGGDDDLEPVAIVIAAAAGQRREQSKRHRRKQGDAKRQQTNTGHREELRRSRRLSAAWADYLKGRSSPLVCWISYNAHRLFDTDPATGVLEPGIVWKAGDACVGDRLSVPASPFPMITIIPTT